MFDSKAKQRDRLIAARVRMSDLDVQEKSQSICEKAIQLSQKYMNRKIHIYLPIESNKEVDTWPLVKELLKKGAAVYTSVFGESRSLKHVQLRQDTVYDYDQLGIPIPTKNFEQSEEKYDLIFTPVVGFDRKLRRLGYGRGVYDSFLSQQTDSYKVGLGYEAQKLQRVKTERHDERLDAVITELQLYN